MNDSREKKIVAGIAVKNGYEPVSEKSGTKPIDIHTRHFFPIIITETAVEDLTGLQVCREARESRVNKKSFIILIRSENDPPGPPAGSPDGPDEYLTRPVKSYELTARLNTGKRILDLETSLIKTRLNLQSKSSNLEVIGRVTSGIIHEINTPVHYVTDNLHFLIDAFRDMKTGLDIYSKLYLTLKSRGVRSSIIYETGTALANQNLEYLEKEIPVTLSQSLEGLQRITEIVHAIRNLSHPGTGKRAPVDINDVITGSVLLTRSHWKHVATVHTDLSPHVSPLPFKPGAWNQVILNLLINAIHAVSETSKAREEKGSIAIITRKENGRVTITIRDTGPGIPDAVKGKIFTPFFTTKEAGKGTGQGLSIVAGIVRNHGGTITFNTSPEKGTTFTISFPVQKLSELETAAPADNVVIDPVTETGVRKRERILFVDDEPNVIQGLRRMLHPMHGQWETAFCENGKEALDMLKKEPFDMIITDFNMEGMNGIDLLTEVKEKYPRIIRMMLSGETSREQMMKSVHVVHRFMAKPCDAEKLKENIAQVLSLGYILTDEAMVQALSKMKSLPPVPSLYAEIMKELRSDHSSIKKIGVIISRDTAMTSKILQLVNSAFFGINTHIASPAEAAVILGLDTIKALILNFELFSRFKIDATFNLFLQQLARHNLTTGRFAREIAKQEKMEQQAIDHAFMAGLLHDSGKLVLATNFPVPFKRVLSLYQKGDTPFEACEKKVFGITHAEVGAYLLGLWGLPVPIMESIKYHHTPAHSPQKGIGVLTALHMANALARGGGITKDITGTEAIDLNYLKELNMEERMDHYHETLTHI